MSHIVAMTKGGQTLGVHVTCVEDHERVGWMIGGDPLDHDHDGKKGGSPKPEGDLAELRAEYQAKLGKKPFGGWDADTLRAKIEAAA